MQRLVCCSPGGSPFYSQVKKVNFYLSSHRLLIHYKSVLLNIKIKDCGGKDIFQSIVQRLRHLNSS